MAKKKSNPVNKKRVMKDPAFERTRENMTDFSRAGNANKLLRRALREFARDHSDRYVSGRLTKRMAAIVYSDVVSVRGERVLTKKALPMLTGFNFNRNCSLSDSLYAHFEVTVDRANGRIDLHFPFFYAATMVNLVADASIIQLQACATSIDFKNQETYFTEAATAHIAATHNHQSLQLAVTIPAAFTEPVIVTLAVAHLTVDRDGRYMIVDKTRNAMAVVKVFT